MNADRLPQPEILEARKVQQPVKVEDVDAAAGRVRVRNAYDFLDLSHLTVEWRLVADGVAVQSGTLAEPLELEPGERRELTLPCDAGRVRPGQETFLEVSFRLRDERPWAPRGHEVAWEQIARPRPGGVAVPVITAVPRAVQARRDGVRVVLATSDLEATIDGASLVSYRWKGEEQLAGPLVPHLWRVPTDNDEGGGQASYAHRWREAGLDRLQVVAQEPAVERLSADRVRVTVGSRLAGTTAAVTLKTTYEIGGDGTVAVSGRFGVEGELPPLPRVGFQLQLPGSYDGAQWYGRGPQESYADRKEGARFGLFRSSVADLHFPYVMAQENGNHTDVRWLELVDARGRGLRFSAEGPLDFTAHDYTDAALLASKTSQVIERDGRVTLSLDLAQMGLGGDDSWSPRVHPEYQLTAGEYGFAFRIAPAYHPHP